MTTLGQGEFIILVNVNPSAFPREVREDTAHFRFLKPTSIRPDFQVAEGLRLIILHRVPTEVIDRLRIAAPAIGQRYVKNVGEAMTFVSGIAITQPDNADERRPKLPPKAPPAEPPQDPPGQDQASPAVSGEADAPNKLGAAPPPEPPQPPGTLEEFARRHLAEVAELGDYPAGKKLAEMANRQGFRGSATGYYCAIRGLRGNPLPARGGVKTRRARPASAVDIALDPELAGKVEALAQAHANLAEELAKLLPQIKKALAAEVAFAAMEAENQQLAERVGSLEAKLQKQRVRIERAYKEFVSETDPVA